MKTNTVLLATLFATPLLAAPALAQNLKADEREPPVQRFNYDAESVEGDVQRPEGDVVESIRHAQHASLIELRTSFRPEILKSLEEL